MGPSSNAEGLIVVNPPLTHREVRRYHQWDNDAAAHRGHGQRDITMLVSTEEEDTDAGIVRRYTSYEIVPNAEGSQYRRYHTESDLRELVELFPEHTFTGYIEQESEGFGNDHELFRLYVVNHSVVKVTPEIRWPDE